MGYDAHGYWVTKATPNQHRIAKKGVRASLKAYRAVRRATLATLAACREDASGRAVIWREDALYAAIEARRAWMNDVSHLRYIEDVRGVEVGAAWSANGLARVRAANKR